MLDEVGLQVTYNQPNNLKWLEQVGAASPHNSKSDGDISLTSFLPTAPRPQPLHEAPRQENRGTCSTRRA